MVIPRGSEARATYSARFATWLIPQTAIKMETTPRITPIVQNLTAMDEDLFQATYYCFTENRGHFSPDMAIYCHGRKMLFYVYIFTSLILMMWFMTGRQAERQLKIYRKRCTCMKNEDAGDV